jgi:DNA-binding MarR family transcriptional regulator
VGAAVLSDGVVIDDLAADPLPGKIVDAIDRLARGQRQFRQAIASRHGLTPLQLDLLSTVAAGPPPEPVVGMLAVELGVSQPTITDSLRALESKNLLVRARSMRDRRRTGVALTAGGLALAGELDRAQDRLRAAVAAIPRDLQETTLEAMLRLIGLLLDVGIIDVARTCFTCRFHRQWYDTGHHCTLLGIDLHTADLRVNCAEHQPALGGGASAR